MKEKDKKKILQYFKKTRKELSGTIHIDELLRRIEKEKRPEEQSEDHYYRD